MQAGAKIHTPDRISKLVQALVPPEEIKEGEEKGRNPDEKRETGGNAEKKRTVIHKCNRLSVCKFRIYVRRRRQF